MAETAHVGHLFPSEGDFSGRKGSHAYSNIISLSELQFPHQEEESVRPEQWFPNLSAPQSPEELLHI